MISTHLYDELIDNVPRESIKYHGYRPSSWNTAPRRILQTQSNNGQVNSVTLEAWLGGLLHQTHRPCFQMVMPILDLVGPREMFLQETFAQKPTPTAYVHTLRQEYYKDVCFHLA